MANPRPELTTAAYRKERRRQTEEFFNSCNDHQGWLDFIEIIEAHEAYEIAGGFEPEADATDTVANYIVGRAIETIETPAEQQERKALLRTIVENRVKTLVEEIVILSRECGDKFSAADVNVFRSIPMDSLIESESDLQRVRELLMARIASMKKEPR